MTEDLERARPTIELAAVRCPTGASQPQGRLRRLGGYFEQAQGQPEAPRHVAPGQTWAPSTQLALWYVCFLVLRSSKYSQFIR